MYLRSVRPHQLHIDLDPLEPHGSYAPDGTELMAHGNRSGHSASSLSFPKVKTACEGQSGKLPVTDSRSADDSVLWSLTKTRQTQTHRKKTSIIQVPGTFLKIDCEGQPHHQPPWLP